MKEMRRKGAFGAIPAIYGVTEAQHNGGLHTHGIGFLSILGMTLKRFAGKEGTLERVDKDGKKSTIDATEALQRVYNVIDSHISAAMDIDVRAAGREISNWVVRTTPVPPKSLNAKQLKKYETAVRDGSHAKCTRSKCEVETKNGDGTCWFWRLKGELEDFKTKVIEDANLTNARLNYHLKCKPSTCLSRKRKCDTCRFAVLKRLMRSTGCSELESDLDDPAKVVAKVTVDAPPPDDKTKTWPLPPDHQIHPS